MGEVQVVQVEEIGLVDVGSRWKVDNDEFDGIGLRRVFADDIVGTPGEERGERRKMMTKKRVMEKITMSKRITLIPCYGGKRLSNPN